MDDYISRKAAIAAIKVLLEEEAKNACLDLPLNDPNLSRCMARYNGIKAARQIIEKRPSADVRPVVRGKWIDGSENFTCGNYNAECSNCHANIRWSGCDDDFNFCPKCGAMMMEE